MDILARIQQIAANDKVAFSTGSGTTLYAFFADLANWFQALGMIAGGILSVLVLLNWIYVKLIK